MKQKKISNQAITRRFQKYNNCKIDDFLLKGGVRVDAFMQSKANKRFLKIKTFKRTFNKRLIFPEIHEDCSEKISFKRVIIDEELINKLSPNNIDCSHFWKKATEYFPLASIFYNTSCENKSELNDSSLKAHEAWHTLGLLKDILIKNESAKILEIGPGYGAIAGFIAENHNLENYYAIDVNPLFKYKKLFKTDGKTIPEQVPNDLDVVYSVNVFQHLTPEQRLSYFEQIKDRLVVGGKFIFSMFVVTPDTKELLVMNQGGNEYTPIFGYQDKQGNYYTNFFSQFTRCNTVYELIDIFNNLNMKFELISRVYNHYCMCATKL